MAGRPQHGLKHTGEVRVTKVTCDGTDGLFFGTPLALGWQATDGSRSVSIPAERARRADWNDGVLTVRHGECEHDGEEPWETFEVVGILAAYVSQLRLYFESTCNIFLHRSSAVVTAQEFDMAIKVAEDAAYRVNKSAQGSVARRAKELDLMERLEDVCSRLEQLTRGDKQVLSDIFGANECERIGRVKLILEKCDVQMCEKDARWLQLDMGAAIVQNVLKECGTYRVWTVAQAQDIWLRRAETVRVDDTASGAGLHDDDDEDSSDDELAQARAEADKEAEEYVPTAELLEMLREEPAPEEETINISVNGNVFSFPLRLARSLDYWDMFEAVSQRVKARKMLRAGADVFELLNDGCCLNDDQWDYFRKNALAPGSTLVASTREAAMAGDDEGGGTTGLSLNFLCCFALLLLCVVCGAAISVGLHFRRARGTIISMNPAVQFSLQEYKVSPEFGQQVQSWMEGTMTDDALRANAVSAISFEVIGAASYSLSAQQMASEVHIWEEIKKNNRVDDVVTICSGMRSYIVDGARKLVPVGNVQAGTVVEHLLRESAVQYATLGGVIIPDAPRIVEFAAMGRLATARMNKLFEDLSHALGGTEAPAEVFGQMATARAEVARALATVFFHPVNKDVCEQHTRKPSSCQDLALLAYLLHVISAPPSSSDGLVERIADRIAKDFDITVDCSFLATATQANSPTLRIFVCVAMALGFAARARMHRAAAAGHAAGRWPPAACLGPELQLPEAPLVVAEEPWELFAPKAAREAAPTGQGSLGGHAGPPELGKQFAQRQLPLLLMPRIAPPAAGQCPANGSPLRF